MGYVINIILADATSLRNRMLVYAINSTPFIATVFAGPRIASLFYTNSTFRWAFGCFSIIIPAVATPVASIFIYYSLKAKKMGLMPPRETSGRTVLQSIYHYSREFDRKLTYHGIYTSSWITDTPSVIGMFLITGGFSLVLLPLTLAGRAVHRWDTAYIIAMIVVGVVLLIAFCVWENFFAPVAFVPFKYLRDRTVLGACILSGTLFCGF